MRAAEILKCSGHCDQHDIAVRMAVGIIDMLKAVNICNGNRDRQILLIGLRHGVVEHRIKRRMIEQAGHHIAVEARAYLGDIIKGQQLAVLSLTVCPLGNFALIARIPDLNCSEVLIAELF